MFVDDETFSIWKDRMEVDIGIVAVGDNKKREAIVRRSEMKGIHYRSVEAPNSVRLGTLEEGSLMAWGSHLGPNATVGMHTILNTSSSVDHDCMLGSFVHVAPGARLCGAVIIGDGTLVGAGAVVLPGIKIGPWLKIPAGAVVARNVDGEAVDEELALLRERRDRRGA